MNYIDAFVILGIMSFIAFAPLFIEYCAIKRKRNLIRQALAIMDAQLQELQENRRIRNYKKRKVNWKDGL